MSESQPASQHTQLHSAHKSIHEKDLHSVQHNRINIARSNSAPQSHSKFSPVKVSSKGKAIPSCLENTNGGLSVSKNASDLSDNQGSCMESNNPSVNCPHEDLMMRQHPRVCDIKERRENFISSAHSQDIDMEVANIPKISAGSPVVIPKISAGSPLVKNSSPSDSGSFSQISNGSLDLSNGSECYSSSSKSGNQRQSNSELIESEVRRHPHRYPFRQAQSEVILPSETQRRLSLAHVTEIGYARLEEELMKAQKALEQKDEEVDELKGIRERLMKEVSDFTASLFEEVNSQLNEAALSEQQARKQLQEANTKIEVLTAEVAALKDLVLTSTPSSPNRHLHPQIDSPKKEKGGKPFWKTHRRSTSHHQFTKESREKEEASQHHSQLKEMDTVVFEEFTRWRLQPTMELTGQFFARVNAEDIQPCLNFKNAKLGCRLLESVKSNSLSIEPIPGDHSYPRKCWLSETSKLCNYKIKFEGEDEWYSISQMARNRIAAVCDFYSYVRYIVQGLVKCSDKDMYAELVKLRGQMAQARLGLI